MRILDLYDNRESVEIQALKTLLNQYKRKSHQIVNKY